LPKGYWIKNQFISFCGNLHLNEISGCEQAIPTHAGLILFRQGIYTQSKGKQVLLVSN
jgi:hypothetical protein